MALGSSAPTGQAAALAAAVCTFAGKASALGTASFEADGFLLYMTHYRATTLETLGRSATLEALTRRTELEVNN